MKVSFVYPDLIGTGKDWHGLYNHGIGALSSVLKKEGYDVSLLHVIEPLSKSRFIDYLNREKPDIIAFSTSTNLFKYAREWSRWAKEHTDAAVICGGPHATLAPEDVIEEESIDAVCIGEGEYSLVNFCRYVEKKDTNREIKGIWLKESGKVYKGGYAPLPVLDELPFADKTIFDYANLTYGRENSGIFMASRGCPYKCTYCCNEALGECHEKGEQSVVRFKSVDHIISEIEDELVRYPFIKVIGFDDDILPLKLSWFEEFVKHYKKNINLPMACNLRPNLASKDRVNLLKEAGCIQISMGVEAGNDYIRNSILKRNLSREQIMSAYELCRNAGIKTFSYNILGLPFEDVHKMLETVKLNAQVKTDMNQASIFYPYPKTALYEICKRENLIRNRAKDKNISNFFTNTILDFNLVERYQIRFIQKFFRVLVMAYRSIYALPEKTSKVIIKIFEAFLTSKIIAIFVYPALLTAHKTMMSTKITNRIGRWILRNVFESNAK